MSPKNRGSKYARAARRRSPRGPGGGNGVWWIVISVIVVIGVALVVATMGGSSSSSNTAIKGRKPAPDALVKKVVDVPAGVLAKVGLGSAQMPTKLTGATVSSTPDVYYVGAEFCPYCAAERWAMLNSLSRFGTFSNLSITTSASDDVYPNTPTFSFYKSSYTSQYLKFGSVEVYDNGGSNSRKTLEAPTANQQTVWQANGSGFPFINFSGKYALKSPNFDVQVLQRKTRDQIAAALSDPTTDISKGAIGAANALTATICKLTNDQPASACTANVKALEQQLG